MSLSRRTGIEHVEVVVVVGAIATAKDVDLVIDQGGRVSAMRARLLASGLRVRPARRVCVACESALWRVVPINRSPTALARCVPVSKM